MRRRRCRGAYKNPVYIILISIILSIPIIISLIITINMFPKVKLSNKLKQNEAVSNLKIAAANSTANTTSRSSLGDRTSNTQEKNLIESTLIKAEENKQNTKTEKNNSNTKENAGNNNKKDNKTAKSKNKKSTTKTTSISNVKISKSMNLTKRTGLSRKDFIKLIAGVKADTSGFFETNAGKIYDLCEKYSINEIFFCGLISAESGWNIASNHRKTHNYISLMKNGKLISFASVNSGLESAAQKLHYDYLTSGGRFYHGKTLEGVKTCFCPSGTWVNLVYGRMQQIVK